MIEHSESQHRQANRLLHVLVLLHDELPQPLRSILTSTLPALVQDDVCQNRTHEVAVDSHVICVLQVGMEAESRTTNNIENFMWARMNHDSKVWADERRFPAGSNATVCDWIARIWSSADIAEPARIMACMVGHHQVVSDEVQIGCEIHEYQKIFAIAQSPPSHRMLIRAFCPFVAVLVHIRMDTMISLVEEKTVLFQSADKASAVAHPLMMDQHGKTQP